jgi:preprotein translocase subunit SecG
MERIILVIHLMIAAALVAVVLMQKSEGGALGIGGGGMSNFMTGRGTASVLTRATAVLAACFMLTSLVLVILPQLGTKRASILPTDVTTQGAPAAPPTAPARSTPPAPATQPATPTPPKSTTPSVPSVPLGQ